MYRQPLPVIGCALPVVRLIRGRRQTHLSGPGADTEAGWLLTLDLLGSRIRQNVDEGRRRVGRGSLRREQCHCQKKCQEELTCQHGDLLE